MDEELAFYSSVLAKGRVARAAHSTTGPLRRSPEGEAQGFSGPGADMAWLKEDGNTSEDEDEEAAASPASKGKRKSGIFAAAREKAAARR